jgi:hypothetical protein
MWCFVCMICCCISRDDLLLYVIHLGMILLDMDDGHYNLPKKDKYHLG